MERENRIAREIVDAAVRIHRTLGPGLFESVYETILTYELSKRGLGVQRQRSLPVVYESIRLERGYRVDLLVDQRVIVEVKSLPVLAPIHIQQVLTYVRLAELRLGIILNFGAELMRNGIRRVAN